MNVVDEVRRFAHQPKVKPTAAAADTVKIGRAERKVIEPLKSRGRYVELDVNEALAQIMSNGFPDPVRCREIVGELIRGAAEDSDGERRRTAIWGECAPTVLSKGDTEAAIRLEHLWDEITRTTTQTPLWL